MTAPFVPRPRRTLPEATHPLRVVSVTVNATVTRPLRIAGSAGDAWLPAIREAMLKRGCLRDRAQQGQCLNCALLPRCSVWPLIAPTDPTRRQSGVYLHPWIPISPTLPVASTQTPITIPVGTQVTHGITVIQDATFPALWGRFAAAYVQAARQLAEWGFGAPVPAAGSGGGVRRGALSVGRVQWLHPVTGESQPFAPDNETDPSPPFWHGETEEMREETSDTGTAPLSDAPRPPLPPLPPLSPLVVVVAFLTPTRLVIAGETQRRPDLPLLVRRIGERVETLCTGLRVAVPPSLRGETRGAAIAAAEQVRIARDETQWVGGLKDGGLSGTITLNGNTYDLAAILPALRWGQALGAGKGAQMGAGRIAVRVPDSQ